MSLANKETLKMDLVDILPFDVAEHIFLLLEPKDLAAASVVNSKWREAVNSNKIWSHICNKKGWKDIFVPDFSHFCKSHKQFREYIYRNEEDSFSCEMRKLFAKHSLLSHNWSCGNCVIHKITNFSSYRRCTIQLFEPVTCYGRYLVLAESWKDTNITALGVWDLNGSPSRVCELSQPNLHDDIDAIAFDFNTIAIVQNWLIIVYHLVNDTFEEAYSKDDLKRLAPLNRDTYNERRIITLFLKITKESIICAPDSSLECLTILFWNRETGNLEKKLFCDHKYRIISNAVWFEESCFVVLLTEEFKPNDILEFNTKTATWTDFERTTIGKIVKVDVNKQYILAVTINHTEDEHSWELSNRREIEVIIWSRADVLIERRLKTSGLGFKFVANKLMYFDSYTLKIENPINADDCSRFTVDDVITGFRPCYIPNMLIIKTVSYLELWDWCLGRRLYTVYVDENYGNQIWSDEKRIITYNKMYCEVAVGVTVLGFW